MAAGYLFSFSLSFFSAPLIYLFLLRLHIMALRQATFISMLVVFMLIFNANVIVGRTYIVGDNTLYPWTFKISDWPKGKTFYEGDILVFNFNPAEHSMVRVNKFDYDLCRVSAFSRVYNSGNDLIKLLKGNNYFICGVPRHCNIGMKMVVKALARK